MGLDDRWLLVWWCLALSLAELFDETHRLALKTALEPSACASVDKGDELNIYMVVRSE